jgi:hypothetical protein
VLDDDKGGNAPQEHGVHREEIGPRGCRGPGGRNCFQVGRCGGGYWVDPGVMQELPHRGGSNRAAELDELALHPPVPHMGLSVAMRMTSFRIAAAVGGRPGRRRLV